MLWLNLLLRFLSEFSGLQLFFLACAVGGGLLFVMRLILLVFTGGGDDLEPGMEAGESVDIAGDSDTTFRFMSLQGIVGFVLIFGLMGLAMNVQLEASEPVSVVVALGAGAVTLIIVAWITFAMRKLDQLSEVTHGR